MNKKWILWGSIAGAVVLLLAAAVILFFANKFHIDLTVKGEDVTLEYGTAYTDEGAEAHLRGKLFMKEGKKVEVVTKNELDTAKVGSYTVTYTAAKWKWSATATRTVKVVDTQAPTLKINGKEKITVTRGNKFTDEGCTANDGYDGDLTTKVTVKGEVDTSKAGEYTLTYEVKDAAGNTATTTRTVTVKAPAAPTKKPVITDSNTVIPTNKTIYLTFDDGPGPYTAKLLDVLKKYNVKATFFVTNKGGYNSLIGRMAAEGHAVGIHTATHDYEKIYASEEAFFKDQQIMQDIITAQTGSPTKLMRFPGGSSNTISNFNPGIMSRLAVAVTDRGMRYFDWNVSSGDAGETTSTAQVVSNIKNGILYSGRYANVLQHDIKNFSVNAVEEILQWGLAKGYTFAALDETSPTCHHGINN
ncbi:MAG: polysaccharide deacetylase family protein [Clostridia bacterium]|nr:polysaccharide deacetylase family protein [Clostridia bacterium]